MLRFSGRVNRVCVAVAAMFCLPKWPLVAFAVVVVAVAAIGSHQEDTITVLQSEIDC